MRQWFNTLMTSRTSFGQKKRSETNPTVLSFSLSILIKWYHRQKYLTMSAEPDPRDVEIERLRNRIRELEINPFNRYERQFENSPSPSHPGDTSDNEFEIFFHNQHPPTPPAHRHRHAPPPPHQPVDPLRSLGLRTEIPEFEGNLQPDDFLDWLLTVERIFDLRDILDNLKVKLVAIKFKKICFVMVGKHPKAAPSRRETQGRFMG